MQQSPAQELFEKGIAAARAGDLAAAEAALRQCIKRDPKHAIAMLNLGLVLMNRGNLAGAEQTLMLAASTQPSLESLSALGEVLYRAEKFDKAGECYRTILSAVPNHAPSLMRLAELAEQRGDRREACGWYKKAWDADKNNTAAGIAYALNVFNDNSSETIRALDQLLDCTKNDPVAEAKVLLNLLPYTEFHERMQRGLMPYHGTSLDELFFTFSRKLFERLDQLSAEASARDPSDPTAALRRFTALFCCGDRPAAQKYLKLAGKAIDGHIYENVDFSPAFYEELEKQNDVQIAAGLPPLETVVAASFSDQPVIFLSCNYPYFENFAAPMIRSVSGIAPGRQLILHIMDATGDELEKLKRFCIENSNLKMAVTIEQPGLASKSSKVARAYYHAIRFIRFYQLLKQLNRPLWLMDVDALFNRAPDDLFGMMDGKDAAFRIRPGRLEPWNQFNACIVGAAPTEASLRYFRLIAAYIAHYYQRDQLRWGIDQLAMYGVFEYLRDRGQEPSVALLGDRAIDYDYLDDGIVWCNSGRNKFLHLDRKPGVPLASLDPDRAKYLELFEKYYRPV